VSAHVTSSFPPPSSSRAPSSGVSSSLGDTLRRQREAKRMSVAEVSRVTRIPVASIEAIERDSFDDLPGEVFARGFLKSYAKSVGLSADDVLARYVAGRRTATAIAAPAPLPPGGAPEGSGRRFGIAIAVVLLLILFTLALSIVLKPRGRDMPVELSQRAPAASLAAPTA